MIIWGGWSGSAPLNTGGRYDPGTNSWIATSTTNAPAGRFLHTTVWSGSEMVVWGGWDGGSNYFNTGSRYNPSSNTWTGTSTTNVPVGRSNHTAIWTGDEMIVWGGTPDGSNLLNTGGRYNPDTNSWIATSTTNVPSARANHTAVWSDSEMIVWAGLDQSFNDTNTGGRYNPIANSWIGTTTVNAPTAREAHTAVWSGSEMIVWGGYAGIPNFFNSGGRYCAQAGPTPTPTPTATPTPTSTPSATATATPTTTTTPTPTITSTPTATGTPVASCTPGWSAGGDLPSVGMRFVGVYFPANGKFYAMGGRSRDDVSGFEFTHPFEYNPTTSTWTTKSATYPDQYVGNMACGVLTDLGTPYIYCVGGYSTNSDRTTDRVFRYNPVTDTLSTVAAPWPGAATIALPGGFTVVSNKLYILGGYDVFGNTYDSIWEFNPAGFWVQKAAVLPDPLGFIPTTTINGLIYTAGGVIKIGAFYHDAIDSWVYNPIADTIDTIAFIPRGTSHTGALTFNDGSGPKMWVMGGGFEAPNPSNEVDIYDPITDTWSLGPPFITARRDMAPATDGTDHIWLAGGYAHDQTTILDSTEVFLCHLGGTPTPSPTATATATATATSTPTPTPTPCTGRCSPTPRPRPAAKARPTSPPHVTPVPPPPSPRPTAYPRPTPPPHLTPVPTPTSPRPTSAPRPSP